MTYRIYIREDYKPAIRYVADQPWYRRTGPELLGLGVFSAVVFITTIIFINRSSEQVGIEQIVQPTITEQTQPEPIPIITTTISLPQSVASIDTSTDENQPETWQTITVKRGDSLSVIFDRLGINPTVLYQILHSGKEASTLKHILPGQELRVLIKDNVLTALEYDQSITDKLSVSKKGNDYVSEIIATPLTVAVNEADVTINNSLFLDGQKSGLSDNLIMQLVAIYGWDIDFALDLRSGDHFKIIYEEHFKDGEKVREGPILAANFVNKGKPFRAVRYTNPSGSSDYYSDTGDSMRKAFLRTPLNFSRISSGFNLRRKHPVLNTIRAHKGVDYAASRGTPIKAAGDGVISYLGRKGGYGRVIKIKHGGNYSTLYAHMNSYAKKLRKGTRVKQGQTIGYVGSSGLATGPHLHYEFRVNGVHRNPLTVKLPKAESVPEKYRSDFKLKTSTLLAKVEIPEQGKTVLAMRERDSTQPALPKNF